MTAIGEAQRRLPVKFYRIAVLFILFDVDIILLVPWAISFRDLGHLRSGGNADVHGYVHSGRRMGLEKRSS